MAIQLFGDPFNLQGGANPQQAANPQATANPQQTYGPVVAKAPAPIAPRPVATQPRATPPRPAPIAPAVPQLQTAGLVSGAFSQYVGARPSPSNPSVAEFYRTDTNQALTPDQLAAYIQPLAPNANTANVFDILRQTPQSQPGQQQTDPNQELAQYAAQGGLSLDDYLKLVTSGVTPQERETINNQLGIPEAYKQIFTPAPSTQDLYNNAYASAGLSDLKSQIDAKIKEINSFQQQYTDKSGVINENPFLSEASRIGRQNTLSQKQQADIGNRTDELNQLKDLYNNGINEVNAVVGRTTQDFSNNQQINSAKLQYLQQQAEQQLSDLQNKKSSAAYQYLPDYLKAKAATQKPDTITLNDGSVVKWDPSTQTFQQVVGPNAKQTDPLDTAYKQLQIQKLRQEIAGGGNANELLSVGDAQTLGVPYGTTKGQAVQMGVTPTKPATDAQNQAATYALRVQQAGQSIDSVASKIVGMSGAQYEIEKRLPSYLQSATYQSYDQAARNLVNAVLRRESGAAISTGEFDNAYAQYLPKPGDTSQTLAQKKQNRDAILSGLVQSSGGAYNTLSGGSGSTGFGSSSDPFGLLGERGGGAKLAAVNSKYPDGTVGGQCGTFAHKIADFPPVGNRGFNL